jgi:CheY-like chemotaxis protein
VNGRDAVDAVAREAYELVLMDCQMPALDGYQATAEIRQAPQGHEIPIVAMTANSLEGDREKCLRAGMNDYVAKPVRRDELARVLSRWTRWAPNPS